MGLRPAAVEHELDPPTLGWVCCTNHGSLAETRPLTVVIFFMLEVGGVLQLINVQVRDKRIQQATSPIGG
jgi:hypothetical protein